MYTYFDKVMPIAQGADSLQIYYCSEYQRIYADSYQNSLLINNRIYIGNFCEQEKEVVIVNIREIFIYLEAMDVSVAGAAGGFIG